MDLGGRDDDPPVPGPEVVDHIILADIGHPEHFLDNQLRRRHEWGE